MYERKWTQNLDFICESSKSVEIGHLLNSYEKSYVWLWSMKNEELRKQLNYPMCESPSLGGGVV